MSKLKSDKEFFSLKNSCVCLFQHCLKQTENSSQSRDGQQKPPAIFVLLLTLPSELMTVNIALKLAGEKKIPSPPEG